MSQKKSRTRYYTFVAYPDSAPENWRDLIDSFHLAWVESPLHDKDVNGDGTPKKAHWHILLSYDSLKTEEQAQEVADAIHATKVQRVESPRALVRYFAHMDNPDKAQYSTREIVAHGGVDLSDMLKTSNQTKYDLLREMMTYIVDNNVIEYEDLVVYSMYNEPEWFEALADNCTYFVNAFIKSRRHRQEKQGIDK